MTSNNKLSVYTAAIGYALITGLSYLFGKVALTYADPFDLLAHRFSFAALTVLILIALKVLPFTLSWRDIPKILPLALLYPLSFFALQTIALLYSTSAEAGIFLAVSPIFTLVLAAIFLREKSSIGQIISVLISVGGVILIAFKNSRGSTGSGQVLGIVLLLLAALSLAGYSIAARKMSRHYPVLSLSVVMILISCLGYNAIAVIRHLERGTLAEFLTPLTHWQFVGAALYLGILSSFITSFLSNFVLSRLPATQMSVFTNLSTVISVVAGAVILKENIYLFHIVGTVLISGGVLGANLLAKKDAPK